MKLYQCDVCRKQYEHATPTVDFDPDARVVGGELSYYDKKGTIEWPYKETYLDVCPECCAAIAETLRERMK